MNEKQIKKLKDMFNRPEYIAMPVYKFQANSIPKKLVTSVGRETLEFIPNPGKFYALIAVELDLDTLLFHFYSKKHGELILSEADARQVFDSIEDLCQKIEAGKYVLATRACDLHDESEYGKKSTPRYNLGKMCLMPSSPAETSALSIMSMVEDSEKATTGKSSVAPSFSAPTIEKMVEATTSASMLSGDSTVKIGELGTIMKAVMGQSLDDLVAEEIGEKVGENWGAW